VKSSSMVKFTSDRYRTKALVTSHELAVLVIIKRCTCILGTAVAQKVWYDILISRILTIIQIPCSWSYLPSLSWKHTHNLVCICVCIDIHTHTPEWTTSISHPTATMHFPTNYHFKCDWRTFPEIFCHSYS
jgi:hypothetical protein